MIDISYIGINEIIGLIYMCVLNRKKVTLTGIQNTFLQIIVTLYRACYNFFN